MLLKQGKTSWLKDVWGGNSSPWLRCLIGGRAARRPSLFINACSNGCPLEGLTLRTWRCQCPGKSWSWSRSAEEVRRQISAERACCRTGSGWRGESLSHHKTLCPPGKHTDAHVLFFLFSSLSVHDFLFFHFSAAPPRQHVKDVVGSFGDDMTQCSIYRKAEDFSSHGRCDLQPLGSTVTRLSSVSLWKTPQTSDRCDHNKN